MFVRILVGLCGLGVVVFVHELGHFLAARLCGIDVEVFSIGWGATIFSRKKGTTEYRISAIPIGGYCKMKGDAEYQEALAGKKELPVLEKGSFYGASPFNRIIVAFAGPLFNVIFALFSLTFVWGAGVEVRALSNRIVLVETAEDTIVYPATAAGLKTGDRITAINGKPMQHSQDIQEAVAPAAEKLLQLQYERDGITHTTTITPRLDKQTGAGKIGIYFWTDPRIDSVEKGSPAAIAGLRAGDLIRSANGITIQNTIDLNRVLKDKPIQLKLILEREHAEIDRTLVLSWADDGSVKIGISFPLLSYKTPKLSLLAATQKGWQEVVNTVVLSVRSVALLFKGVDLTKSVSGPVRITKMVGDVAVEGFSLGIGAGLSSLASFLSLLSISLFIMNLLPIPALDGGLIVLFIIEIIRGKPLSSKGTYIFQLIGTVMIISLLLFSLLGDILFLTGH